MKENIKLNNLPNYIPEKTKEIIFDFSNKILSECEIVKIILYGSYARNEATEASDIDIAIFTDISEKNESFFEMRRYIYGEISYNIEEKYNFEKSISPILLNIDKFKENINSPYYQNIKNEGVCIYERTKS